MGDLRHWIDPTGKPVLSARLDSKSNLFIVRVSGAVSILINTRFGPLLTCIQPDKVSPGTAGRAAYRPGRGELSNPLGYTLILECTPANPLISRSADPRDRTSLYDIRHLRSHHGI